VFIPSPSKADQKSVSDRLEGALTIINIIQKKTVHSLANVVQAKALKQQKLK